MVKRTLQHILLASSLLLNPNSLLTCGKQANSCSTRHRYFSNNRNYTFLNQKLTKSIGFHSRLKYSTDKSYRLKQKVEKFFQDQGIPQLSLKKTKMEGASEPKQLGIKLPPEIKGMKKLDKTAFETKVNLPCVIVNPTDLQKILYMIKTYVFKMQKISSVQDYDEANIVCKSDEIQPEQSITVTQEGNHPPRHFNSEGHKFKHNSKMKVILLDPFHVKTFEDFGDYNFERLASTNLTAKNFAHSEVKLTYDNFSAEEILKAVLPSMISSFTSVGHIVQCNLREEHIDYKFIIGQVLLDKVPQCETVVSKTHSIDNTYRNFEMELLAGRADMVTVHKENGCMFKMDFSKVYWNSRLSTEHERIYKDIRKGDLVLDVFAGVGPFSIPAAWKGARVIANDLNPDSVYWLEKSQHLNKHLVQSPITIVNKDARDFIQSDVRTHLLHWIKTKTRADERETKETRQDPNTERNIPRVKIIMNLPASAVEYVKYLRVLSSEEFQTLERLGPLPLLYLYDFQPKMNLETKEPVSKVVGATELFAVHGLKYDEATMRIMFVRNVAPNKNMYRVMVPLTRDFLVERKEEEIHEEKREGEKEHGETREKEIKQGEKREGDGDRTADEVKKARV